MERSSAEGANWKSRLGYGLIVAAGLLGGAMVLNTPVGFPTAVPGQVIGCSRATDKWIEDPLECRIVLRDGTEHRLPFVTPVAPGTQVYLQRYKRRFFGYAYVF